MKTDLVSSPKGSDVVIIGAPFDGGTSHRPGARFGPNSIREQSVLLHGTGIERGPGLHEIATVVDAGDLPLSPYSIADALSYSTEALSQFYQNNRIIGMLGGDHSLSLAALRAANKVHGQLTVIHLDAHSDTYSAAYNEPYHHGAPFRHAIEEGLIRTSGLIQIGIRGHTPGSEKLSFARSAGSEIWTMDSIMKTGLDALVSRILQVAKDTPVYISLDVDVLDPAFAPGTGTPAPGGFSSREVLYLLQRFGALDIIGFDIMEVSPPYDESGRTALFAAEAAAELSYRSIKKE